MASRSILQQTLKPHEATFTPTNVLSSGGLAKNLEDHGIKPHQQVLHNPSVPILYEHAVKYENGTIICDNGALAAFSGQKTGRSPKDKRVVDEPSTTDDIWWGPVNIKLDSHAFLVNRERAIDYLNLQDHLYVIDAYAGWDERYRIKIRVVCSRAYHALFMRNMLIRPSPEELANFGEPDFTIYNAGSFPANRYVQGMSSACTVSIDFSRGEMIILGTQYAGEMKKGVLTLMMYLMPKRGQLCLHSSANEGKDGNLTLFFGLSGTGKTTLSADPHRMLLGDDEHVWTSDGVFNIEGGCYAKCIGLSEANEPDIYRAVRFGSVVENVVIDPSVRTINYDDDAITQNTRCAYPLEFIPNAKIPAVGAHPNHVILLACDAFAVLPPVAKLTPEQCMYQFISGYTSKIPGTEQGVTEPQPTFSACFGGPFLVWHPTKYAEMLAERLEKHNAQSWLVNTGWVGGPAGGSEGARIKLRYTRAIIDAIHSGELAAAPTIEMPGFGFHVPAVCPGVPSEVLKPWENWADPAVYKAQANKLINMFNKNFEQYLDKATDRVKACMPKEY